MTTQAKDLGKTYRSAAGTRSLIGGLSFDWAFIGACTWLITGGYLDSWAHNHFALDTFFTPWHGVLYSGFVVVALVMVGAVVLNHMRGASWHKAIPAGYELSVLGVFGFAVGGVADMFWHVLFGIEKNIDAQLSPSHLLLMICLGLIIAGPFRSAWRRSESTQQGWLARLQLPVSLLLLVLAFSLLTQTGNPFIQFSPTDVTKAQLAEQSLAILGIVFQSMLLVMLILLAIRRWHMPLGSFTLVLTLNAISISIMRDHYLIIPIFAVAGGIIDVVYHLLKPTIKRVDQFRMFAAAVPSIIFLVYFLTLWMTMGIVWSIHLSVGSVVVAGIAGWLVSYIMIPPAMPVEQTPL